MFVLEKMYPPLNVPLTGSDQIGFYKSFGRPVAKVFLGAIFTYQVLYWGWAKLESLETRHWQTSKLWIYHMPRIGELR